MKNQHTSALRKTGTAVLTALLIAVLSVCLTLVAYAIPSLPTPEGTMTGVSFASESGIVYYSSNGSYAKVYDGTAQIDPDYIQLKVVGETAEKKPTDVSAYFVTPTKTEQQSDVGEAKICISYKWAGVEKKEYLPASITPKSISFGDFSLDLTLSYDPTPGKNAYQYTLSEGELALVKEKGLSGVLSSDADQISLLSAETLNIDAKDFNDALIAGASLHRHLKVTLGGSKQINYTISDLDVTVAVAPLQITEVVWSVNGVAVAEAPSFSYGDSNSRLITAVGRIDDQTFLDMIVKVKGSDLTLALADEATYGAVRGEAYVLEAINPDPVHYVLASEAELDVTFTKAICEIQVQDAVFAGDAEHAPTFYPLPIADVNQRIPTDVLSRIQYRYTLDGVNFTDAPTAPGKYTVHIALDEADTQNYELKVTELGEGADGVITVNILPYRLDVGSENGNANVLVFAEKGTLENVKASVLAFEPAPALLKGFTVYKAFTLTLTGAKAGDSFKLVIPVHSSLLSDPNTKSLTDADLYVISGDQRCAAKDQYTVTLADNGAYYIVEGVAPTDGAVTISFMIAPVYSVSFWATVPGVALIVFLILLAVFALTLLGLLLRRMEKREINPVLTIDTEGDVPKVEEATAPDKLGSAEECIDESLNEKEAALYGEVAPERTETPDIGTEAVEMAAEMVAQTANEAAQMDLSDRAENAENEEIDAMITAMAEERAAELSKSVDAEADSIPSDDVDLTAAVGEAIDETVKDDDAVDVFARETAEDALAAADCEAIDSIVTEVVSAFVELPDGFSDREAPDSMGVAEASDAASRAELSVKEAICLITADGAAIKVREGYAGADLKIAVAKAVKQYAPEEWTKACADEVTDAITAALEKALFN